MFNERGQGRLPAAASTAVRYPEKSAEDRLEMFS
jgi:hypothetical protein